MISYLPSYMPLPSREAVERNIRKGGNGTISIVYFKGLECAVKRVSGQSMLYMAACDMHVTPVGALFECKFSHCVICAIFCPRTHTSPPPTPAMPLHTCLPKHTHIYGTYHSTPHLVCTFLAQGMLGTCCLSTPCICQVYVS